MTNSSTVARLTIALSSCALLAACHSAPQGKPCTIVYLDDHAHSKNLAAKDRLESKWPPQIVRDDATMSCSGDDPSNQVQEHPDKHDRTSGSGPMLG